MYSLGVPLSFLNHHHFKLWNMDETISRKSKSLLERLCLTCTFYMEVYYLIVFVIYSLHGSQLLSLWNDCDGLIRLWQGDCI